jgi:hypothetical protein
MLTGQWGRVGCKTPNHHQGNHSEMEMETETEMEPEELA